MDTDVSDFHIVRALATAGNSDLVFESSFPDLLARESQIHSTNIETISWPKLTNIAPVRPQTLSQFDILAPKSVMSEGYFESHILQITAKILSDKFCNALAHFILPNDQTIVGAEPDGLFPVEAHSSHTEDPVAKVSTEAFVRTLKLKQDLVLLRSKYKLVVFNPGGVFDSDTMIRDGDGHSAF